MQAAVLDASVLFRGGVRDFLLWIAEAGAFTPIWSDQIHEEWIRSRRVKFGDPALRLDWARSGMERDFRGGNFDRDGKILASLRLRDRGDVHVVATAVAAEANSIVTYNEKHFPEQVVAPLGLRAETPDFFCARLGGENSRLAIEG